MSTHTCTPAARPLVQLGNHAMIRDSLPRHTFDRACQLLSYIKSNFNPKRLLNLNASLTLPNQRPLTGSPDPCMRTSPERAGSYCANHHLSPQLHRLGISIGGQLAEPHKRRFRLLPIPYIRIPPMNSHGNHQSHKPSSFAKCSVLIIVFRCAPTCFVVAQPWVNVWCSPCRFGISFREMALSTAISVHEWS